MLTLHPLRTLQVDPQTHPRGQPHLSSASGLVHAHERFYVIADDEHHLGVFTSSPDQPGALLRLFAGDLPASPRQRKQRKPDLEALASLPPSDGWPAGALLALGSGSRSRREKAVLIALGSVGDVRTPVRQLSLDTLYAPLRRHFDELNIEGALVVGDALLLLHRGNKGDRRNASIRFSLNSVWPWLAGSQAAPQASEITHHDLGDIDGIPLCFTDGAALEGGAWVYSAVAEDTDDAYEDGRCHGAALGVIDAGGARCALQVLPQPLKVEGIAVQSQCADEVILAVVTDADDPAQASKLLTARLTIPTQPGVRFSSACAGLQLRSS